MAEAGAGGVVSGMGDDEPAAGALVGARVVLVDAEANEESAELRLDVALHRQRYAVAVEPELQVGLRTFQRLAFLFVQAELNAKDKNPRRFALIIFAFVFAQFGFLQCAAKPI